MTTANIATDSSNSLTCVGDATICVGDATKTNAASCSHNYVSCVTCRDVSGTVKIRVQTNSLPNHCWRTSQIQNVIEYREFDYEVNWNHNVQNVLNQPASLFTGSTATETILCDISRTQESNMPAMYNYVAN